MNPVEQLGQVAVLGQLLNQAYNIAQGLAEDPNYTKQDAIEDVLKLARMIKEEIVLSRF
ncbi:hypothetical protein [Effusibacillus pohliae]|uniref:hypothetical protein n=1 Tax=Effusibacillus pohliae TaxID=232270 RepID=UPI00035EA28D|nr:hypothetical protein [Effusibacillus pohliae]